MLCTLRAWETTTFVNADLSVLVVWVFFPVVVHSFCSFSCSRLVLYWRPLCSEEMESVALHDFAATQKDELSFKKGDIVKVSTVAQRTQHVACPRRTPLSRSVHMALPLLLLFHFPNKLNPSR